MKINKSQLTISIMVPVLTGLLAGILTRNGAAAFGNLNKPPLSPPAWLFPVVWTVLYVLMGIASYLASEHGAEQQNVQTALLTYYAQLVFNFAWPVLFFNFQWYFVAFICLVVMWILILSTLVRFWRINRTAGILMLPYLLWTTFAGYLNLAVYFLN